MPPADAVAADGEQPAQVAPARPPNRELTLADTRRIQAEVMDFADDMRIRLAEAIDEIENAPLSIEARTVAHRIKFTVAHGATIIAAQQNPRIALLDMMVMITLQRELIERNIVPEFFGPEADRLRSIFESSENQVRTLVTRMLTAEQLAAVDDLARRWLADHPDRRYAGYVRLSEFAGWRQLTNTQAPGGRPANVLGFLFIDPLAGLDPTTREIEQARFFAERALYYVQRMPELVSWQAELLIIDTLAEPEVRGVLRDAAAAAEAATVASESARRLTDEVTTLRAQLPALVASERAAVLDAVAGVVDEQRQAAIEQALAGLRAEREATIRQIAGEQERLGPVIKDLREAIEAGTALSDSLRETTGAVSGLAAQLDLGGPSDPDSEPFRVEEYTTALREARRAAEELGRLTETLASATAPRELDTRLATIEQRLATAEDSANRVLDRAFRLGLMLVGGLTVGLLAVVGLAAVLRRRA